MNKITQYLCCFLIFLILFILPMSLLINNEYYAQEKESIYLGRVLVITYLSHDSYSKNNTIRYSYPFWFPTNPFHPSKRLHRNSVSFKLIKTNKNHKFKVNMYIDVSVGYHAYAVNTINNKISRYVITENQSKPKLQPIRPYWSAWLH